MRRGVLVAMSGVDGSGKSTQAKLLEANLREADKSAVVLKTFEYLLLKPFINLKKGKNPNFVKQKLAKNHNPFFKIWFIFALLDYWAIYIIKIRRLKSKYDYIISDRYFLDMAVTVYTSGLVPESLWPMFVRILPKPTYQIIFEAKPSLARSRSKEFGLEYYQKQSDLYHEASRLINCGVVDSTLARSDIASKIIKNVNHEQKT